MASIPNLPIYILVKELIRHGYDDSSNVFEKAVSAKVQEGYIPVGGVVVETGQMATAYTQAMILKSVTK